MPRKAKKTPAPKKGSKKGSKKTTDLDGSISQALGDSVSTSVLDGQLPCSAVLNSGFSVDAGPSSTSPAGGQPPRDKSDAILAYLERLDQSNQALTKRISDLETNRSAASTPHNARTRSALPSGAAIPPHSVPQPQFQIEGSNTINAVASRPNFNALTTKPSDALFSATSVVPQPPHQGLWQPEVAPTQAQFNTDAVIPSLSALRQNQEISQSVNQVLASYENQAKMEATQGKGTQRKSGRFNNTDTVTLLPQFRWPNEGLASVTGKKRVLYDELSVSEWAAGQLSNIYLIQDPVLVKQAMLQTIQVLKDATSLPWQAVRTAYAQSMHQVEQGTLSWQDTTQWALNRISSSQIAMANAATMSYQQQNKKVCKFYNEGLCSNEGSHGNYKHVCSHCVKSGRNLGHPESKCVNKHRGGGGHQGHNSIN